MPELRQHIMGRFRLSVIAIICFAALSGCARHAEDDLRQLLNRWFSLGDTVYFQSKVRCTAAVFELRVSEVKSALRLETEIRRGLFTLERTGIMALTLPDQSPDQVLLSVIEADPKVGAPVQNAAVFGRDCMDQEAEGAFHAAITGVESLLVWLPDEAALVLFDPVNRRVVLASGVYR